MNALAPGELLRWTKSTGRLILLIPAGWSSRSPSAPPGLDLLLQIVVGGLAVSGAGIANDLWDRRFDGRVERTKQRPLARGAIGPTSALVLLIVLLSLSLAVVLSLDEASRQLCLLLSIGALPAILLYPSAKRWFAYPQAVLAFCWGFAVLSGLQLNGPDPAAGPDRLLAGHASVDLWLRHGLCHGRPP